MAGDDRERQMTTKAAQQAVEMILVRQLASYLFVPVLVFDSTGTVVFYNEPAERILGVRFEETGRIDREEADRLVELSEDPSAGPEDSERPLDVALQQRRPAHARRWLLRRADRVRLQVELTAFPIIDHEERLLGAVAMFWEHHGP
jgi:PAS domain-containing protein